MSHDVPDETVHYENLSDEELERELRRGRGCAWLWLLAFVVAIVLVSLPVLRALPSDDRNSPEDARRDARRYVAQQFATDALERRSTRRAAGWAIPALYDRVDDIVGYLQSREPDQLREAELVVASASCSTRTPAGAECFHAWLDRPGGGEVIRVSYAIAIVDGRARIIALEIVQAV